MMWKLWIVVVGWLPVLMPCAHLSFAMLANSSKPYQWIKDSEYNVKVLPLRASSGFRTKCGGYGYEQLGAPVTPPVANATAKYRYMEIVFKVCGSRFKAIELHFATNFHGRFRTMTKGKTVLMVRMTENAVETELKFCEGRNCPGTACEVAEGLVTGKSDWKTLKRSRKDLGYTFYGCQKEKKIRLKWQDLYPWNMRVYLEPGVGEVFSSKNAGTFNCWTNQFALWPIVDPTKHDIGSIWFYYTGLF